MRTVALLQARSNSTRLPSKVLASVNGKPLFAHVVERVSRAHGIDDVAVATSDRDDDLPIIGYCVIKGIKCWRGASDDVLDRMYRAAQWFRANTVVRITCDCPMIDPAVIEMVLAHYRQEIASYCTNTMPPSWPDGLDVEVMGFGALDWAWRNATLPSEREHCTTFIRHHPELFALANVPHVPDLSGERWCVDTPDDLAFCRAVFAALGDDFRMDDVLALLDKRPELRGLNSGQERDESYRRQVAMEMSRRRDKQEVA